MERRWRDLVPGKTGARRDRLAPRRYPSVPLPTYGSNFVRRLGVRCNLWRLLVRQQGEEYARRAGSGRTGSRRPGVRDARLSGRCGGYSVLMARELEILRMAERAVLR